MKITWIKGINDDKSFKIFENFGADVKKIENLEETDNKIKELVSKNYTTIVVTPEIASFSEDIIKKYNKNNDIKIIIAPPKE